MIELKSEKNFNKGKDIFIEEILNDYRICVLSREVSLMARKEVLTGKAKFGILGDGKEVPQVAMARAFQNGDFRSGYYRDQTLMFALGLSTVSDFFAQLYADSDNDPFSGGRQMNAHFATPLVDENGEWLNHTSRFNISSDISTTGGQMARGLGLALASKIYRANPDIPNASQFSINGDEVCFCTIGDASTSEGVFWETMNAAGVMQVPLAVAVWDDGYGISVPKKFQTTKESISEALKGLEASGKSNGIKIYKAKAWDYQELCEVFTKGIAQMRKSHMPALFHIEEVTQPQGHSTSGSHERYKTKERLDWEDEHDCIKVMRDWILTNALATEETLVEIEAKAKEEVKKEKTLAWKNYNSGIKASAKELMEILDPLKSNSAYSAQIATLIQDYKAEINPTYKNVFRLARKVNWLLADELSPEREKLVDFLGNSQDVSKKRYQKHLYNESSSSALNVPVVAAEFEDNAPVLNGYEILNAFFDKQLESRKNLFAFGEDVGQIGDVNQGFAGMQEKYGVKRVFDTGIREWTIVGQAIGMSMRGLKPICEIQYLDYLAYAFVPLTDDLATVHYRSNGTQVAPAIIRTRGHRLEGIWHSGSPMGMMLNGLKGINILVPRNMTIAAGFYNTLLQSKEPGIIIECLNGYRLKEKKPRNLAEISFPLGVPEVLEKGTDVTLLTYGSCVRIAEAGIKLLEDYDISVELIDVQTLIPFDLENRIVESLKKTNRIIFMDEDVPGGATAFMLRDVMERQGGYQYLDAAPVTLSAKSHRSPYGSDGDYFTKPQAEDVFETVYNLVRESSPNLFPKLPFSR